METIYDESGIEVGRASRLKIFCKNCGQDKFYMHKTGEWFWMRCGRCGFHTSSYLTEEKARIAAIRGEHYISENGNKCIYD